MPRRPADPGSRGTATPWAAVTTLALLLLLAGTVLVHAGPAPEPSGPQPVELIISKTISIPIFASPGDVIEVHPVMEVIPRAPPLLLVYSGEKTIRCTVVNGLYLINGKVTGVLILRGETRQSVGLRVGKHGPDIRALVLEEFATLPEDAIAKVFQVAKGTLTVNARFRTDTPVTFGRELQKLSRHVGRIRAAQIMVSLTGNLTLLMSESARLSDSTRQELDRNLELLKALAPVPWLSVLVSEYGHRGLRALGQLTNLRKFWVSPQLMGRKLLGQIRGLVNLEELDLSRGGFVDADLRDLLRFKRLRKLDLSRTYVTDRALPGLGTLGTLQELSLERTSIRGTGLGSLCGNRGLRSLNLASSRVGDAAMQRLTCLRNLDTLRLSDTRVGDQGLASLFGLKGLRYLFTSGTKVTDRAVKELQRHLPGCKVNSDRY